MTFRGDYLNMWNPHISLDLNEKNELIWFDLKIVEMNNLTILGTAMGKRHIKLQNNTVVIISRDTWKLQI